MYTSDSVIEDNVSIDNTVGYAIMFSDRLKIVGNVSDGDRDHGRCSTPPIARRSGNRVTGRELPAARWLTPRRAPTKAWRPHPTRPSTRAETASARRSACSSSTPTRTSSMTPLRGLRHRHPLHRRRRGQRRRRQRLHRQPDPGEVRRHPHPRLVGGGRGNYWSDNPAFDLDGDGIADAAYRPNDIIDRVMWTAPQARLLVTSPAVQVIRWAQSRFPAMFPAASSTARR